MEGVDERVRAKCVVISCVPLMRHSAKERCDEVLRGKGIPIVQRPKHLDGWHGIARSQNRWVRITDIVVREVGGADCYACIEGSAIRRNMHPAGVRSTGQQREEEHQNAQNQVVSAMSHDH